METTINRYLNRLLIAALITLILSVFMLGSVPPTSRDALTHHLAIPKLWIENGSIYPIHHLVFSYYPMNIELLYLIPLYYGNDIIPKYIHYLFGLATAWMIFSYLKKRTSKPLALFGSFLFLSTPIIVKLSTTAYVDLGLIFFSWGSIYQLIQWCHSRYSFKHLIFSAILCGLCLGTKYNGLLVLCLLTLFIPIIYSRTISENQYNFKRAVGYPIVFIFIAFSVYSPWMIRNFRLTGNPIYPLYNKQISGKSDETTFSNMSMKPWMQRKLIYKESAMQTLLIPLRVFFQGKDDNPRYFDGKLNPILLFFPLILLIMRRNDNKIFKIEMLFFASFTALFILYASFMVDMRIRYIAPVIPLLIILTVFGLQELLKWINSFNISWIRVVCLCVLFTAVIFFISLNISYTIELFHKVNPVPYISGKISREDYLKNNLPDFQAINFINHLKNDNKKIFAMFVGRQLYYFDKPVEFGSQTFKKIIDRFETEKALTNYFQAKGFTYCIIGIEYFKNWANLVFTDEQKKIVSDWLSNSCRLLFSKNGYAVFQLIN